MAPSGTRKIDLIDTTVRDGQQSLWATRMTNDMFMPYLETMDAMGYASIDLVGGAVFDVCVRFLREDPWQRMKMASQIATKTPLNVWTRGQSLFTFEFFADDIVALSLDRCAANGIKRIACYDSLNDIRNIELSVSQSKDRGMYVCGHVVYTVSPVHTDAFYAEKAAEIAALKPDAIGIKDPSGLLTPERIRTLAPAVRGAIGDLPLELHSHCRAGLGELVALEAVSLGVGTLHVGTRPLASSDALPDARYVITNLKRMGFEVDVDPEDVVAAEAYFTEVAKSFGKPIADPNTYDPFLYHHQIPGGMISNLHSQLNEMGLQHRFEEVLEEVGHVRHDLGYPILVSPFAQFVVTQSVMNVAMSERYQVIPDEVQRYVLGFYGKPAGDIDPEILGKVRDLNPGAEPLRRRPGEYVPPQVAKLRAQLGASTSDDDLLLAAFYKPAQLNPLLAARRHGDGPEVGAPTGASAAEILRQVRDLPRRQSVAVRLPDLSLQGGV